jgi:hypothetical protein
VLGNPCRIREIKGNPKTQDFHFRLSRQGKETSEAEGSSVEGRTLLGKRDIVQGGEN